MYREDPEEAKQSGKTQKVKKYQRKIEDEIEERIASRWKSWLGDPQTSRRVNDTPISILVVLSLMHLFSLIQAKQSRILRLNLESDFYLLVRFTSNQEVLARTSFQ